MAYIKKPAWAKVVQEGLYVLRFALLVVAGILAVVRVDAAVMDLAGWTLIVGSVLALVGVISRHFAFEQIALWLIIGALILSTLFLFSVTNITTGFLVLALTPGLGARLLHLTLVAKRARAVPGSEDK